MLWGSSTLTPYLLEAGLADEILLLVFPVLLGTGKLLFSSIAKPRDLALIISTAAHSGVLINTYRPIGAVRTGTIAEEPTLYLFFKGNSLEAITHYADVLGGEIKAILRNGDLPDPESRMLGDNDLLMNITMTLGRATVMASDSTAQ